MTHEDVAAFESTSPASDQPEKQQSHALLRVTVSEESNPTVVVLEGELDDASAPFLQSELLTIIESPKGNVVLDIGGLTFLDSSGLALFVVLHKRLESQQAHLVIASPTAMADRLFEITGLKEVLTIRPQRLEDSRPLPL